MKNQQGFEDMKYYSACCRCQYYIDKKCTNKGECVWKNIENELKEKDELAQALSIVTCENGELLKYKKALKIISQNFKLVGNCLHAKNKYAESGWVFVKELEDEEEHNAWKEMLL